METIFNIDVNRAWIVQQRADWIDCDIETYCNLIEINNRIC